MIPIFDDSGNRMPITYNGLTLNAPIGGDNMHIYEVNAVMVRDVFSGTIESRPEGDGSEVYGSRKSAKLVRIDGIMRARTFADLYDMSADLHGSLDPAMLSQQDSLGHGFSPLEFDVITGLGNEESYLLARPVQNPDYLNDQYLGKNMPFRLEFFCADPRRYLLTANLYTFVESQEQAMTQNGNYPSVPAIEITMNGAGSALYQLINKGVTPNGNIHLNLTGVLNGDSIIVYPLDKVVTRNGDRADDLVLDDTDWNMLVQPGTFNFQVASGTNATTEIIVYHTFSM